MRYQVDEKGFYGDFGGAYIPEMLYPNIEELRKSYIKISEDGEFQKEFKFLLNEYVGRPTPLYFAERLSDKYNTKIYLKREDLCHTGAHKVNNTIGQILLAKRLGKLLLRPNRPALGQAGVADAGLPLLSRLRLAKLQRLDRHGRQHVERIRPGEEVVPKLDDRLAMIARGQLIRPRGGIPLPMPSLDRGDLLHHLFLDQAAIRPIRGCWLSGNSRLIWLAGRVSRVSRDE